MPGSINILHISDLHCGIESGNGKSPGYIWDREEALEAFHRDFSEIPSNWRPNLIVITGDLGWTGSQDDYQKFETFLKQLFEVTNLDCTKVICCPGNHDKFLEKEAPFPSTIRNAKSFYEVKRFWDNLDPLSDYFQAYSEVLKSLGIPPLENNSSLEQTKYLYGCRIVEDICFLVFNSAWLCDWRQDKKRAEADKGCLLIDIDLIKEVLRKRKACPSLPTIALYHHPNEWLKSSEFSHPEDPRPTAIDMINEYANIVLHGHTHDAKEEESEDGLRFTAGTISSDDTYVSRCWLLKLEIDSDDIRLSTVKKGIYYTSWDDKKKLHWKFREKKETGYFDKRTYYDVHMESLSVALEVQVRKNEELNEKLQEQQVAQIQHEALIQAFQNAAEKRKEMYAIVNELMEMKKSKQDQEAWSEEEQELFQKRYGRIIEIEEELEQDEEVELLKSIIHSYVQMLFGEVLTALEDEPVKRLTKEPNLFTT